MQGRVPNEDNPPDYKVRAFRVIFSRRSYKLPNKDDPLEYRAMSSLVFISNLLTRVAHQSANYDLHLSTIDPINTQGSPPSTECSPSPFKPAYSSFHHQWASPSWKGVLFHFNHARLRSCPETHLQPSCESSTCQIAQSDFWV